MPTYDGIGETITHKLEIEGDLFLQDIEGGSLSTQVPLEIFSDFETSGPEAINSRMLRLRVQNYGETDVSNSYVTDFGIRGEADKDYFFITAPQNTSNVGDQNTFVISSTSNVGIGTTDPGHYRLLVNNSSTKHFGVPGNDTPTTGDTLVYNEDGEWVYHFVEGTLPPGTVDNEILTWNGSNWVPNSSIITTNSNTSIGIGTYTPSANLHVIGSVTATTDVDISGKFQGGKLRVGSLLSAVPTNPNVTVPGDLTVSGTLTSDAWIHTDDVTINGNIDVTGTITASNIVGGSPLTITSDENLQVNSNLTVGTSNLFVDNLAGRVGIGVVSPGAPLEVVSTRNADTWSSGASQLNVLNYNGSGSWYGMSFAVSQSRGNGVIQTFNKNSGAAAYHLELQPSAGNVGIGTNGPIRRLDVRSGTSSTTDTTDWISGTFGPQLNNGDRVVIGNIFTKATIGGHNSSLTAWADLIINPGTGNVGIGITNPSYQLQLSTNSAAKPTSSAWTVSSDQRIKEDIFDANLDTCYENVKNLKLKYYKLRDDIIELDPIFKDAHKLGWIAQEVEEVLPKCVTTIQEQYGLNDVKNLDVDQIYTNLFGAVQKLIKENENLKARIEALENSS